MTDEQNERLKQIRERLTSNQALIPTRDEADFLLSLVDSQEPCNDYACMTFQEDETLWCSACAARAEYLRGRSEAAESMRSACIEKVKAARKVWGGAAMPGHAVDRLIADLESVTIQEQKKQS